MLSITSNQYPCQKYNYLYVNIFKISLVEKVFGFDTLSVRKRTLCTSLITNFF